MKVVFIKTDDGVYINALNVFSFSIKEDYDHKSNFPAEIRYNVMANGINGQSECIYSAHNKSAAEIIIKRILDITAKERYSEYSGNTILINFSKNEEGEEELGDH